jgi:hypothetical protein
VDAAVVNAARALGPNMVFFTSRARPLARLADLRHPGEEAGTGDLGTARGLQSVLRAGGVPFVGGAYDLMRLASDHQFAVLFTEHRALRFFAVRARPDGRERLIAEKGGGVRVVLRAGDTVVGQEVAVTKAAAPAGFVTSFGPLVRVELAPRARHRLFDAVEGARVESREARKGSTFVVVRIDRDFGAGFGTLSFLYGSGVMLKPELERLLVVEGGRRRAPAAIFAEGRTVELAYEVAAEPKALVLRDGADEVALTPLLAPKQAAAE